ncbi:MAG: hypothetical protein H7259_09050 [Cytophagales bacterium]|nr:hypothetical protein [Cytophaga sp.]
MALDHVRDFFHHDAFIFLPTDPEKTTVALFATRWITHICAPIFAWLTGVSAWIYYHKKGSANTSIFLISRGLILIVLEFTVIRFAWHFRFDYPNLGMLVIWALGFSMVVLGILQFLQQKYVFVLGVLIILLHNFLDDISFGNQEIEGLLWHVLHESGKVTMSNGMTINVLYPALPVIGLMCIGFGMGTLFTEDTKEERIAVLKKLSYVSLLIFISLRMLNDYGDPGQWIQYEYVYRTVFSFLNVTKYPMSLEYVLITMSIAFYLLIKIEQGIGKTKTGEILSVFGKVSMFFYLIHLFVIHALAVLVVMVTHYKEIPAMVQSNDWDPITNNYGYSLIIVYLVWIAVLTGLYPLCLKYRILKSKHPDSLLKYI